MIKKTISLLAFLVLVACQPTAAPAPTPTVTQLPAQEQPTQTASPQPSPTTPPQGETTPMPGSPTPLPRGESLPFSAYPPSPGDAIFERGNVFLDSATITPASDVTGAFDLSIEGSLPTPCHELRVILHPPGAEAIIQVEVYSVADPQVMCTQVIKPFAVQVARLGGYPPGVYRVLVNEIEAGEITVP